VRFVSNFSASSKEKIHHGAHGEHRERTKLENRNSKFRLQRPSFEFQVLNFVLRLFSVTFACGRQASGRSVRSARKMAAPKALWTAAAKPRTVWYVAKLPLSLARRLGDLAGAAGENIAPRRKGRKRREAKERLIPWKP
jgi:hypothetical protein